MHECKAKKNHKLIVTFCDDLRRYNYLGDLRDVCLEEKISITLFILAHNT